MRKADEILKTKAVILYILGSFPDGINFIKLFKMMYLAQQEHLVQYGLPIFKDTFHAYRDTPAPSLSHKCFKIIIYEKSNIKEYLKPFVDAFHIDREKKLVFKKEDVDMDYLAIANVKILDCVIEKYGKYTPDELSKIFNDTAWKKAVKRANRNPEDYRIYLIDIAKAGGAEKSTIEYIRENLRIEKALKG